MLLTDPQMRYDELYKIYEDAFPEPERRTREGQQRVLSDPMYRVRVKEEDGHILAFAGYWNLPGCQFLEHLATSGECRRKGYGQALVEEFLAETDKPAFLEIEPVTEKNPMTGRRRAFYERLGFVVNLFPYEQMALREGGVPIPLWVMSHRDPITEEGFMPFKKEIYRYVYGV